MERGPTRRLEELFAETVRLDAGERAAYVERVTAEDPELGRQLRELLELDGEAGEYFAGLAEAISTSGELELAQATSPRVRVGPYRTFEVLGSGGMGVVYRARRVDGEFDKEVALKVLHLDMLGEDSRARFLAERQILARLEHPGIARLLDGGVTEEGRPFFVMELVEGRPITEFCRQRGLSLEQTLGLFRQVVDAVAYLHRSLVVHRDLKPSNVLVDADGRARLLDFGIAKLLGERPGGGGMTVTGQSLLTPRYAAPEQVTGGAVTTATDVFGLGVVLYELLTGRLPHDRTELDPEAVRREATAAPSRAIRGAPSAAPETGIARRRIAGDLDRICLKALRPEPERRYASAEQLDLDLERFLTGRPVSARPSTLWYRASRFVKRHRTGVVVAVVTLALLAAGLVREQTLRLQAQEEAAKATAVSSLLGRLISSADPANARGREITVSEVLGRADEALAADADLAGQPAVEAEIRRVLGETYRSLGENPEAIEQLERAIELGGGVESGDETVLRAAQALGLALRGSDWDRAEELLRRVVAVRERTRGTGHESTLSAMATLSRTLQDPEDFVEAEALDREVLERRREALGQDHPKTLRAMNSLGGTLFYTARYEEAAELYREALEVSRRRLGTDHPDTLRLASNLASTLSALGRYAESEVLEREVLAAKLRVLGAEHEETGTTLHNLGIGLLRLAKCDEALPIFRRAIVAREELTAGGLYSKSFLADCLRDLGRLEEAERVYEETLAQQRELFSEDFKDAYRTTLGLAGLRLRQGDHGAAAELAETALEGFVDIHGEEHPQVVDSLLLLARIARERGRLDEAGERIDRAVAVAEAALLAEHPGLLDARLERARIRWEAGEVAAALSGLSALVETRLERLGPAHPESRRALELASAVHEAAGRTGEAAGYSSRLP